MNSVKKKKLIRGEIFLRESHTVFERLLRIDTICSCWASRARSIAEKPSASYLGHSNSFEFLKPQRDESKVKESIKYLHAWVRAVVYQQLDYIRMPPIASKVESGKAL